MGGKSKLKSAAEVVREAVAQRPPLDPKHQAIVEERKARKPGPRSATPARDIALQTQYDLLREAQPAVIQRLLDGVLNREDPLHERCLDILSKRVAPIAFWEGLSKEEFKPDEEHNRTPQIVINVTGGAGTSATVQAAHEVVDVEAKEVEE